MNIKDHFDFVRDLIRESKLLAVIGGLALLMTAGGLIYEVLLTPEQQAIVSEGLRKMLSIWYYFLIAFMVIVIIMLYTYIMPRLDIKLLPELVHDGDKMICVVLWNYGSTQPNCVFRLEDMKDAEGRSLGFQRQRFQREGSPDAVTLRRRSPKRAYIARLDQSDPNARVEIMTVEPSHLGRDRRYIMEVSLVPSSGLPCYRSYAISVNGGELCVKEL